MFNHFWQLPAYLLKSNWYKNTSDFLRTSRLVRNSAEYSSVLPDYLKARSMAKANRNLFESIHTYVMFIGIGRSGTTLIGSLLDAHEQIIIANQQSALKYLWPFRFNREHIFSLLLNNSRQAALDQRKGGGGYCYAINNQWQGRFNQLTVIGDKSKTAQSVEWIYSRPQLLQLLHKTTQVRIKILHVVRNPYDTIATRSFRRGISLEQISKEYFLLSEKINSLILVIDKQATIDIERIPIHLENFIDSPKSQLFELCKRLDIKADQHYLQDCEKLIQPYHHSRNDVLWDNKLVVEIKNKLNQYEFLEMYQF